VDAKGFRGQLTDAQSAADGGHEILGVPTSAIARAVVAHGERAATVSYRRV
jgi:hypothetical protein